MSPELTELVERVKAKQPANPLELEAALTRFIADLPDSSRVFCRGEVRNPEKQHWFPAVLTYNTVSRQTRAWAPSGRKGAMEAHHEAFFWSLISHVGAAREGLSDADGTI